ncbi:MAG: EAL domain-containing protein (putative c-di-GMP-specific phosphodiesterase class I), partial [Polyangiales bacterium]
TPSAPRETSGVRTSARLREMFSKDKLLLEYSPCFDAAQGNIVVAEGRLTWRPAAAPSTTPREFFRTLDDAQENDQLSEWVVNTACGDLLRLRAASPTIRRVSVHVSAQQLLARGFVRTVLQGLEETGVTPSCLELSLTDEAVTRRPDQALLVMRELKKHGVRLSMVEFGASCSSLFHLSLVPLDTIKVHPRFVRELSSNTHYQFVLAGIVAMAKEMGVAVHAGGIETSVQYDFLTSTGCDLIQGPMVDERMSCGLWAQPTGTLCA